MSRTPTDRFAAWAYWREWLARGDDVRTMATAAGYYLLKDGKARVPIMIDIVADVCPESGELLGDEVLMAWIGDRQRPRPANDVWTYIVGPITEEDYRKRLARPEVTDLSRTPVI